jgi:pyridoxal phosphate enzyme (YggS family)
MQMSSITDNLKRVRERIAAAAERSGRCSEEIQLVAVTKTVGVEAIREAISCGVSIIGESRIQDALAKRPQVSEAVSWHLVGHLQRNKVKKALEVFDLIHSVDSIRLAEEISRRSQELNRQTDILVQVNTSGEESKFGLVPQEAIPFLESIATLQGIRILGLMTIGIFSPDPEQVRPCFVRLREIFEQARDLEIANAQIRLLSMGMTNDFSVAIEEGANMVRIGTAIFHA